MDARKFFQDDGDNTVRVNYNLNPDSVVLDIGFFKGTFSKKMFDKYGCFIYAYEPMKKYYNLGIKNFINNKKIFVNNYGLGEENLTLKVNDLNDQTSILFTKEDGDEIVIKDICEEFKEKTFNFIDLIKINIEGAEYNLMKKIIDNNLHKKIKNFQIQFHQEHEKNITRAQIQNMLSKTHRLTYNYDYVWENWELL